MILIRKKEKRFDPKFQIYFGCFLKGYKPKYFFWEFVIMTKKIVLIASTVLIKDVFKRCTVMLCLITFFIWLTLKKKPFLANNLNFLEYYSNYCSLLFILTIAICTEKNQTFLQVLCLFLSFLVNCLFVFKWLFSVLQILFVKYQNICFNYCPCAYIFFVSYFKFSLRSNAISLNFQHHEKRKATTKIYDYCFTPFVKFQKIIKKVKQEIQEMRFQIVLTNNFYELEALPLSSYKQQKQ